MVWLPPGGTVPDRVENLNGPMDVKELQGSSDAGSRAYSTGNEQLLRRTIDFLAIPPGLTAPNSVSPPTGQPCTSSEGESPVPITRTRRLAPPKCAAAASSASSSACLASPALAHRTNREVANAALRLGWKTTGSTWSWPGRSTRGGYGKVNPPMSPPPAPPSARPSMAGSKG